MPLVKASFGHLDDHQIGHHHAPPEWHKTGRAAATKPKYVPKGVNGNTAPIAITVREVATRIGWARLLNGLPRVRMMKITNTWVDRDSTNQPVWNSVLVGLQHDSA